MNTVHLFEEVSTIEEDKDPNDLEKLMEPLLNKKERMIKTFGRELSPETLRKERNKIYSQTNRRKKKEYVHILENKVEELERKVIELTDQLRVYKNKVIALESGFDRDYEDLKQTKAYFEGEFLEYLE